MRIARRLGAAALGAASFVDPCSSAAGACDVTSSTIAQPYGPRQRSDSWSGGGLGGAGLRAGLRDVPPERHLGDEDVLATQ